MVDDLTVWQSVTGDAPLMALAQSVDPGDVAGVASLRKRYPAGAVSIALELVRAREKAVVKFGERGRALIADVAGVEQASGGAVAAYKAGRVRAALGDHAYVADLCCGIGGDSMALVDAGLGVVSVDREAVRAWMARQNTAGRSDAVCADVACLSLGGVALHIDPARRDESVKRRAWRIEDYQPGPAVIGRLISASLAAAVKLSPGIEVDALPWPGEVEFISERGRLVQAVLWAGRFASAQRRATHVDHTGTAHTLAGEADHPPIDAARRYLYAFDASVERAQLMGRLCEKVDAPAIHPRLGLLSSERLIDSPWLTGFELIERLPWRPRRVKQWLAAHDGGLVEVKTRGKACDPDREQHQLRGDGGTTYTVFVLRFDTKVEALIAKRL